MLLISGLATVTYIAPGPELTESGRVWLFFADPAIGLLALGLTFLRHRHPVLIAVVVTGLSAISLSTAGPAMLVLVSLATRRRYKEIVPVAALAVGAGFLQGRVYSSSETGPWWMNLALSALVIAVVAMIGVAVGQRRQIVDGLRDRAETAEREQQARVTQARTAERARIAREMHDVLAHRISLVAMHAGVLSYRRDLSADGQATAAATIEENAQLALRDLRDVLGVLRDPTAPPEHAVERPQPTLAHIPELIEQAAATGTTVNWSDRFDGEVPAAAGRAVYRIVQESLTNARKHAPGAMVDVTVAGSPSDGIDLVIRNPASVNPTRTDIPGAGLGLVGLRERAELAGGRLEHGTDSDGGFTVRAWLPCEG